MGRSSLMLRQGAERRGSILAEAAVKEKRKLAILAAVLVALLILIGTILAAVWPKACDPGSAFAKGANVSQAELMIRDDDLPASVISEEKEERAREMMEAFEEASFEWNSGKLSTELSILT